MRTLPKDKVFMSLINIILCLPLNLVHIALSGYSASIQDTLTLSFPVTSRIIFSGLSGGSVKNKV